MFFYPHPLWAAVGVTLPPYYTVYDAASRQAYERQGHGDQPYYVLSSKAQRRQEALALFSQPGQRLVTLQVDGPFVSPEGIDWERCEPADSEFCILAPIREPVTAAENIGDAEHRTFREKATCSSTPALRHLTRCMAS
jgi:hypothetical protein